MKTTAKPAPATIASAALRSLPAMLLALLSPPILHAVDITSDTPLTAIDATGAATSTRVGAASTVEYVISDGATLTISNLAAFTSATNGTIYGVSGGTSRFTIGPSTPGGTGQFVLDGGASSSSPSFNAAGRSGGAFYLQNGTQTLELTSGTIKNFWATGNGGVLWAQTSTANAIKLNFTNVTFINNGAIATSGALDGGVIWANSAGVTGTFKTVTFASNTLTVTNAAGTGSVRGGAVFINSGVTMFFENALFSNNAANASASTTATARGGAVMQTGAASSITITSGTFSGNSAKATLANAASHAAGGAYFQERGYATLTNVHFENNSATNIGGAFASWLDNNHMIQTTFNNVTFAGNKAAQGGAYALAGTGVPVTASGISGVIFNGGTFSGNQATEVLGNTAAAGQGGALYLLDKNGSGAMPNTQLNNIAFLNNTAQGADGQGGAIYLAGGGLDINITTADLAYTGNTAYGSGATALAANGGFAYIAGATGTLNFNIASGRTLTIGTSSAPDADTIIGAANASINFNLLAANTGTIILHGNSTANLAAINIARGTLLLGNTSAALGGPITIASTARAGGIGTLGAAGSTVTLAGNATLQVGYTSARTTGETLNIAGNLNLATGSILDFGIFGSEGSATADLLNIAGDLIFGGGSTINVSQLFTTGNIELIDIVGSLATLDPGALNLTVAGASSSAGYFTIDGTRLILNFGAAATSNSVLTWTGSNGNAWTGLNWMDGAGAEQTFLKGDIINLAAAPAPVTGTLNIAASATISGLYLGGDKSYTINGPGTIVASNDTGSFTGSAASTGKLILGGSATADASAIHETPAQAYTGTLTLANASNNFTGGIIIHSGELVGNALTLGAGGAGGAGITNNATLTFDQAATGTYAAPISGTGLITKKNTGNLILTANNNAFTGTTNIAAGALTLGNPASALGGRVNLLDGAALGGSGTFTGNVFTSTNNTITIGALGNPGETLFFSSTLTLNDGTIIHYDNTPATTSDLLHVNTLVLNGTTALDMASSISGTYKLITVATGLAATATANLKATINGDDFSGRSAAQFILTANDLSLAIFTSNLANITWSGTNGSTWLGGHANWQSGDNLFLDGDGVIFNDTVDTHSGLRTVNIGATGVQVVDMRVSTTGVYTFTGEGGITASKNINSTVASTATGALAIDGPGTVILNNGANTFEGGIYIYGGTLQGNAATLGAPSIANAGALVFNQTTDATYAAAITGPGSLTKTGSGALTLTSTASTHTGAINVNAGTLTIADGRTASHGALTIAANATLAITAAPGYTVQNTLAGAGALSISLTNPAGAINFTNTGTDFTGTVKLGAGAFNLSGPNTAALSKATLSIGADNTTTVGTGTQQIGNLALDGGKLVFSATLPPDTASPGIIQAGILALNAGTVQINVPAPGAGLPNPPLAGATNLFSQDDGTLYVRLVNAASITGTITNITLIDQNGNLPGGSSVDITESGATVATGTYSYKLTATSGLNVNYALTSLTILDGKTLHLAPDDGATGAAATFAATISGNGNLSISASNAPVTLSASNNYTGATTLASGTLIAGANNALGSGGASSALTLAADTTFDLNGKSQTLGALNTAPASTLNLHSGTLAIQSGGRVAGALSGTSGRLDITGGNLLIENANATLAIQTAIAAGGTLTLGNLQSLGAGRVTIDDGATLTLNNTASGTFATTFTGNGALNLAGAGITTIAASNDTFDGATSISGPVIAENIAALGTSDITVASTGNLTYTASGDIDNSITGAGTLNLAPATGPITLNGANTIATINILDNADITATGVNSLGNAATRLAITNATITLARQDIAMGAVTMHGASRIAFSPINPAGKATMASLTSTGDAATLLFNTDIGQASANTIEVTGAVTGAYHIIAINTGAAPADAQLTIPLIAAGSLNATFTGGGLMDFPSSMTAYTYSIDPRTGDLNAKSTPLLSTTGGAVITNATASLPLTWFTELDSIEKRIRELRMDSPSGPRWERWLRGYTQRLKVNNEGSQVVPFREDQYGVELGVDYGGRQKEHNLAAYIGGFFGYGNSSRIIDHMDSRGNSESFYGGPYVTFLLDNGWYVDLVAKYNYFRNSFSAVSNPDSPRTTRTTGHYKNKAFGGSVEAGRRIGSSNGKGFYVTPAAQAALTRINGRSYRTDNNDYRTNLDVHMDTTTSRQIRGGLMAGYTWITKNRRLFQPYAKAYLAHQWTAGGTVRVDGRAYGPLLIQGNRIDAGAGFNWKITGNLHIYFDFETAWADDYRKPYGLNFGINYPF